MKMTNRVSKYLTRRADLAGRPLVATALGSFKRVVVIPALAEPDLFTTTLASLAANPAEFLTETLVIVVVNNRTGVSADSRDLNAGTLTRLQALVDDPRAEEFGFLRVGFVDASSQGNELRDRQGVGTARKLGMDWALKLLGESGVILSLDGDTAVEPNYLSVVAGCLDRAEAWAAAIDYAHPVDGDARESKAIVFHELFLRYHMLGLDFAGSPYAFHTIGSAMALRSNAYVAISGMNKREAGEDFYFLQQLAKTGRVDFVHGTTVHPSSRVSSRVPFGTGASLRQNLDGAEHDYRVYHPESYRILRDWLLAVRENLGSEPEALLASATAISPALSEHLSAIHFCRTWERLQRNARDTRQLLQQFHRWFDGLKTLRLIHHLRDNVLPDPEMRSAITTLLSYRDDATSTDDAPALLDHLRALSRSRSVPAGIFNPR